ncbi:hypothetical protein DFH06DRAFT_750117 [Mycena polygramma]|nr:hypothetical protein DFH06DRAFT_750117 [Mycena polygramma]
MWHSTSRPRTEPASLGIGPTVSVTACHTSTIRSMWHVASWNKRPHTKNHTPSRIDMHPSLRLERPEKLPASIKDAAKLAAQGSDPAVRLLIGVIENKGIPESQMILLLPAFYAALDPKRIPTTAALDTTISARSPPIASAILSLGALVYLPKPEPAVYAAVWSSAWAWIEFLHTYKLHLLDLPVEEQLYFSFMVIISDIQAEWNEEIISSSPGLRAVVARSWVIFLERSNAVGISNTCHVLIRDKTLVGTPWLDEYIDGAGGTVDDLAATVIRHINIAITDEVPLGTTGIFMLLAVGTFLLKATCSPPSPETPFEAALLTHGVISALTKAICTLNAVITTHSMGASLLELLLSLVGQRSMTPPGYPGIAEALQAGLLRAIASSTIISSDDVQRQLRRFLSSAIPDALVYRSALVQMPKALDDVQKLVHTRTFRNSELYQSWLTFQELANDRVKFSSLFVSERFMAYKGCDNMPCSVIHEKHKLKRCSGCLDFYYCSPECQSLDWIAGHRQMCATYRAFRIRLWIFY